MATFSKRLGAAQRKGGLTTSDLARWFQRPRATVATWVEGRSPFGPQSADAEHRLDRLEVLLRWKGLGGPFPVPAKLNWRERIAYVEGVRDDAISGKPTRLPALHTAG